MRPWLLRRRDATRAVIAAVLTAAMVLQYVYGELPCPLCLLQRVAMLGVCFGLMQNFRSGFSDRNLGYSLLLWSVLIAMALITAFATKLCIIGTEDGAKPPDRKSLFGRIATVLSLYVIAIALANFGSVVAQCGLGQCHTTGYALLK